MAPADGWWLYVVELNGSRHRIAIPMSMQLLSEPVDGMIYWTNDHTTAAAWVKEGLVPQ